MKCIPVCKSSSTTNGKCGKGLTKHLSYNCAFHTYNIHCVYLTIFSRNSPQQLLVYLQRRWSLRKPPPIFPFSMGISLEVLKHYWMELPGRPRMANMMDIVCNTIHCIQVMVKLTKSTKNVFNLMFCPAESNCKLGFWSDYCFTVPLAFFFYKLHVKG